MNTLDTNVYSGPIMHDHNGNRVQTTVIYNHKWQMYEPIVIVYDGDKDYFAFDPLELHHPSIFHPRFKAIMKMIGKPSGQTIRDCATVYGAMNYAIATALFYIDHADDSYSDDMS